MRLEQLIDQRLLLGDLSDLRIAVDSWMHQLHEIQQVLILSDILIGPKQNSVKLDLVLSPRNPIQKRLYHTLNLATYASP